MYFLVQDTKAGEFVLLSPTNGEVRRFPVPTSAKAGDDVTVLGTQFSRLFVNGKLVYQPLPTRSRQ